MSAEIFIKLQEGIGGVLCGLRVIEAGCPVGVECTPVTLLKGFGEKLLLVYWKYPDPLASSFR